MRTDYEPCNCDQANEYAEMLRMFISWRREGIPRQCPLDAAEALLEAWGDNDRNDCGCDVSQNCCRNGDGMVTPYTTE